MRDLGLDVAIDAIGNVVATRPGTDPSAAPVMTGSHIDTVATGGRFDGNLGVLAGLEVIETLEQHGIDTVHPIAVGFFTDEEGARFAPDMLGSLVYVGGMPLEEALDIRAVDDGARLGDELDAHRLRRPAAVPDGRRPARLRRAAHRAGPDPRGRGHHDRRGRGRAGHLVDRADDHRPVGARRHDADAHAPRRRLRRRGDRGVRPSTWRPSIGGAQVGTVGRFEVRPDLVNVVPNDGDPHRRPAQHRRRRAASRPKRRSPTRSPRLAAAEGVTVDDALARPLRARRLRSRRRSTWWRRRRSRLGHSTRRMPSGAGHDAQMLARICPAAMIFTPSVGGLSHNIAEHTHPADVTAGANVLLQTLLALATPVDPAATHSDRLA